MREGGTGRWSVAQRVARSVVQVVEWTLTERRHDIIFTWQIRWHIQALLLHENPLALHNGGAGPLTWSYVTDRSIRITCMIQ